MDASRCGWVVVEVGGQVTARAEADIGFFSRCGWVVVEVGGQVTARAGAGIGFFSRRGWGFCRGSRALVRLWNGRNVGNRHFTLAINRRGSESDGVCDIWELLTRISCFLVEK